MKCIVFTMPPMLIRDLYIEDAEPFMHQYVVTEQGQLMVPWYDFIDPHNETDELKCSIIEDVEYYDVNDLMKYGLEEYRDTLKSMVLLMLNFHRRRFDPQHIRGEA